MGTTQKLMKSIFGKKESSVKSYKPDPVPDEKRSSFSPRYTAKNNRKRTKGRRFYYQSFSKPNCKGKMSIKHMENESH